MARAGFENPGPVSFKTRGQPVTEVDRSIESAAREAITARWPEHSILGEEMGATAGGAEITWYIDPIDGTMNFTRGVPFFAVSIGAARGNRVLAGHVLDPLRREHFRAMTGGGAWLGGERLGLGRARDIENAMLSMQTSERGRYLLEPGFMAEVHRRFQKTRKLGTIALELAYVAAGRVDLLIAGKHRPQAWWDIAGGWALVEEAGGVVCDEAGRPLTPGSTHLVAGHPDLVDQFLELFRGWVG
jgi:myo-inositol-1(or 4)-monophosphatase